MQVNGILLYKKFVSIRQIDILRAQNLNGKITTLNDAATSTGLHLQHLIFYYFNIKNGKC